MRPYVLRLFKSSFILWTILWATAVFPYSPFLCSHLLPPVWQNWSMLWSHPCYYPCFFAFCVLKTEVLPFSPLSYTQISWKSLNALLKWGSSMGSQGDSHPPWASGRAWGTRLGGHLDHILLRGAIEVFLTEYHRKMFPKHRTTISRIMSTMSLNPHLSPSGVPSYFWVWMKV